MERRVIFVTLFFIFTTPMSADSHLIDGIFTEPTLEPGYHLVATIPTGATNLNVSELRHTNNYLAVRLQDGKFLLNGNYSINWSGIYKAAGTNFVYHRQTSQQLESFTAIGPLLEPIDVMLLYQEPNSGIVYRYLAPGGPKDRSGRAQTKNYLRMIGDEAPAPPLKRYYRKRKFAWRSSGFSACTKTCGGGVQTRLYICIREHNQAHVPTKRCHGLEKPPELQSRCNIGPCPPKWRLGTWSKCSVTCGIGKRKRDYECVQEVNNLLTVRVADGACMDSKLSAENETCSMSACENDEKFIVDSSKTSNVTPHWNVGEWSSCSTSCGIGTRTRSVTCITRDRYCPSSDIPADKESCVSGVCPIDDKRSNTILDARKSRWLQTEWSHQCSAECGTGFQTRKVICVSDETNDHEMTIKNDRNDEKKCEKETRPESTRICSSNKTCSGQWFTGPWTQCSASCDLGEQTREAICMTILQGSLRIVLDMNCPPIKPEIRKSCKGPPCQAIWYTSDWSECTRSCGTGTQSREVKCLNPNNRENDEFLRNCNDTDRPDSRQICNDYPCRSTIELRDSEGTTRSRYIQNDPEATNGVSGNEHCNDNMSNCSLVTQARLCIYPFYRKICCSSCSRSRREELE